MSASVRKIEVECFSLVSPDAFEKVGARLEAAIGHPDISHMFQTLAKTEQFSDYEREVKRGLGPTGLMLFMKLDHGTVLQKDAGRAMPKMIRFILGNPLIMKEMAKHAPDAGSYAPVTVLVDERADGVHLSYDRMASHLASCGSPEALKVARDLDANVEKLLKEAAGL
jgi:uncharacterized protein (DUF302 family)